MKWIFTLSQSSILHQITFRAISIREPELGNKFLHSFSAFEHMSSLFWVHYFANAHLSHDVFERKKNRTHKHQFSFHRPLLFPSDGSMSSSLASYKTKKKQAKPQPKRWVLCCCTTRKPETQQDLERYGISISNSVDLVGLEQLCPVHVSSFSTQWCDWIRFCYYLLQESEIESSKTKTSKGCHLHADKEFAQAVSLSFSHHKEPSRWRYSRYGEPRRPWRQLHHHSYTWVPSIKGSHEREVWHSQLSLSKRASRKNRIHCLQW